MLSFHGKFGVNSASFRNVISSSVLVQASGDAKVRAVVMFFFFFAFLLLFVLFYGIFHDFGSLVSVLVLFSECVDCSHLVAQSFSLQEIATRDSLVSCH